jgi:hypothetical protein
VAMDAGLIAAIAEIDLQRVELPAPDRRKGNRFEQGPGIAHEHLRDGAQILGKLARQGRRVIVAFSRGRTN